MATKTKQQKTLYYRWEFMRRSGEYKSAYDEALHILAELGFSDFSDIEQEGPDSTIGRISPEYQVKLQRINALLSQFPLASWIDPQITGEEMLKNRSYSISVMAGLYRANPLGAVRLMIPDIESHLDHGFCKYCPHRHRGHAPGLPDGVLALYIDLRNIDSYEDLYSLIIDVVKTEKKFAEKKLSAHKGPKGIFKSKRRRLDLDMVLKVGDLRQQGDNYESIASGLMKARYDESPAATVRLANFYGKRYEEFVNGEYRSLTYP